MRYTGMMAALLVVGLATSGSSGDKPKKPRLDLRASPRVAFSPVNVLMIAELQGGDAMEDFHCPEVEWDWGDGAKSSQESDCPPLEANGRFERRFTAQHAYRQAGNYNVKVTMRRSSRPIAVATATVTVRPGFGDMSELD
jgi:hypothetical protein